MDVSMVEQIPQCLERKMQVKEQWEIIGDCFTWQQSGRENWSWRQQLQEFGVEKW